MSNVENSISSQVNPKSIEVDESPKQEVVSGKSSGKGVTSVIFLVAVLVVISIIVGVIVISTGDSNEQEGSVDNSFCSQFGISDTKARAILNDKEALFRYLNNEKLTCIPEKAFSDDTLLILEQDQAIIFDNCPIKVIHPNAFHSEAFASVVRLELKRTHLSSLQENVFEKFTNLVDFSLAGSFLTVLDEDIFGVDVFSLSTVILESSQTLKKLPNFVKRQKSLDIIDMSKTQIALLEDGVFNGFTSLDILDVSFSPLALKPISDIELSGADTDTITGVTVEGFCNFEIDGDETARENLRVAVNQNLDRDAQLLVIDPSLETNCFPLNCFKELEIEDKNTLRRFSRGTLVLNTIFPQLHPLAFFEADLYQGFETLKIDLIEILPSRIFAENQFQHFVNLKNLEIDNMEDPNQIEVNIFGDECPLETLTVRSFFLHQPPSFLASCKNLREVDFTRNIRMTFLNPEAFRNLPNLERVVLTETPIETFFNVSEIASLLQVEESVIVVS